MLKHVQTSPHRYFSVISEPQSYREGQSCSKASQRDSKTLSYHPNKTWLPSVSSYKSAIYVSGQEVPKGCPLESIDQTIPNEDLLDRFLAVTQESFLRVTICPNCNKKKKILPEVFQDTLLDECEDINSSLTNEISITGSKSATHVLGHKAPNLIISRSPESESSSLSKNQKSKSHLSIPRSPENKLTPRKLSSQSDDVSLNSSSTSHDDDYSSCLTNSVSSLQDNSKHATVRVWVRCLLQEMEYKTVCLSHTTTCRQVVDQLLSKFKMKHRDPNLFYLSMEVTIRKAGAEVRTCLSLEDNAYPAQLVECHPKEDYRLALRMRRGGLLKIYDETVVFGSLYKSVLVGEKTSCAEVIVLVLACSKITDNIDGFGLFEVWDAEGRERQLSPEEEPLSAVGLWSLGQRVRFEIKRCSKPSNSFKDATIQTTPVTQPDQETSGVCDTSGGFSDNNLRRLSLHSLNRNLKSLLPCNSLKTKERRRERCRSMCLANIHFCALGRALEIFKDSTDIAAVDLNVHSSPLNMVLLKKKRKCPKPPPNCQSISELTEEGAAGREPSIAPLSDGPEGDIQLYNNYENYFYI